MGSAQSELRAPILDGDLAAARAVLDSYGQAAPLLVDKQFNAYDGEVFMVQPLYTTPACFAIMRGRAEILRLLMERGADVNEGTQLHWSEPGYGGPGRITLLHHAAKKLDAACTAVLVEYGADVFAYDAFQQTPLHYLAKAAGPRADQAAVEAAELLTRAGGDEAVRARDSSGRTPLHYAAQRGCGGLVAHLLTSGADAQAMDCAGCTPHKLAERHPTVQSMLPQPPTSPPPAPSPSVQSTGTAPSDGRTAEGSHATSPGSATSATEPAARGGGTD